MKHIETNVEQPRVATTSGETYGSHQGEYDLWIELRSERAAEREEDHALERHLEQTREDGTPFEGPV